MGAAAQPVPQGGKTIAGPDGKRIFFPAGTSDDDIAAAFGGGPASKPSLVAPTPAGSAFPLPSDTGPRKRAASIVDAGPSTRTGAMIEGMESNPAGQHEPAPGLSTLSPRHLLHEFGVGAGNAVTGVYHEFDGKPAPPDPTAGMTPEQRLQYHADATANQGEQQVKAFASDPGGAYAAHVGEQVPAAIVGGAVHAAVPLIADAASTGLNKGGRLLKGAGAVTSRLAVGAPAAVDAMGADAGAALSRNRIMGVTRRSLQRKVASTVAPASEARDAILARSEAAPTDVQPLTQAPFDDISETKTDPQTGAVQPGAMRRLNVTRKAIQQVQDPESGRITDTPKDLNLTPQQMGRLQTNVYDMTDYQSPESTLSNDYTKSVGARLKGAINTAAPEAETATDNIHDLLGAQEHLKATTGAPPAASDLGLGKLAGHLYDAVRTGGGTAAGAGLDLAGTGMMKAGGVLRRAIASSPVAPAPQTAPDAGPPKGLPVPEAPGPGPEDLDRGGFPQRPSVTTPAPSPTLGLPASASDGASPVAPSPANTHPGTPGPGARTRVTPSLLKPANQQVLSDQPGFVPPRGTRPLIAGPDGRVTPQPYPLPAPPAPAGLLESATGRATPSGRPSLLRQFRNQAGTAAVADTMDREGAIAAGKEKLAATPEAPPEQAAVEPPIATNMDPSQVKPGHRSLIADTDFYHGSTRDLTGTGIKPKLPKDVRDTYKRFPSAEQTQGPVGDWKGVYLAEHPDTAENYGGYIHKVPLTRGTVVRKDPFMSDPSVVTDKPIPAGRPSLIDSPEALEARYQAAKTAAAPAPASATTRLPDPGDVDGWERLVDEGKAQYNVHTHSYDYTGPIRPKLTR